MTGMRQTARAAVAACAAVLLTPAVAAAADGGTVPGQRLAALGTSAAQQMVETGELLGKVTEGTPLQRDEPHLLKDDELRLPLLPEKQLR
ncbi:hypothetical protein [Streptomyces lonarensis]|uniref:Secreted protein n=1 Tax=Streptomyces lonarensis TaxID=700599 RepID=A0A7X6HYN4_9ACTN|nr:hypothetical protein [Streptomyces lonarensis]NJQ05791.1 hypothetical protein [Streptomyces lonarensis]